MGHFGAVPPSRLGTAQRHHLIHPDSNLTPTQQSSERLHVLRLAKPGWPTPPKGEPMQWHAVRGRGEGRVGGYRDIPRTSQQPGGSLPASGLRHGSSSALSGSLPPNHSWKSAASTPSDISISRFQSATMASRHRADWARDGLSPDHEQGGRSATAVAVVAGSCGGRGGRLWYPQGKSWG